MATQASTATEIRPFTVDVPEEKLEDLRRRIKETRWPEKETVTDQSQGVQLPTIQALAHYWETEYDFRRLEARLNALPQFITEIDGLDIHFIHVKSPHENALPLIITHGWPGSVVEMLNVIDPLTDPTAHGGSADDAFHVVIPSMPGYGFSAKPEETGWDTARMARAWAELMQRLGYTRFVAQGGDWGALVTDVMGAQAPPGLLGIHSNMPGTVPENKLGFFDFKGVTVPAAVSVFPNELYQAPRSWAEQAYPNLIYFNEVDKGNHFAAWQEPELFTTEVRAAFRSLRTNGGPS